MKIRRVTKKDLPEIIEIIKTAFHYQYTGMDTFYCAQQFVDPYSTLTTAPLYSKEIFIKSMISDLKNKFKKPFEFFVAETKKEIVGFIVLEKHLGNFWINNMMVKKEYQGKGIGKKLFKFATKNKGPLYLGVNAKNPAFKFWKKMGFKEVLRDVLMIKK